MSTIEPLYVTFRKKDERFIGHKISLEKPTDKTFEAWMQSPVERRKIESEETGVATKEKVPLETSNFASAISSFLSMMTTYRNTIPFTIELTPLVSTIIASEEIGVFVRSWGEKIEKFESEEFSVYEISQGHFGALIRKHEAFKSAMKGAEHLPEISIIGLISVYDAYLSKLLKVIFHKHEGMVFTSDRDIKYSDLLRYKTLEDAKSQIIEKEVESVIRNSHHEQFEWMERKFKLALRADLQIWPDFVELCERRNLLTHTGGVVSDQYRNNCAAHGRASTFVVGERLNTDPDYFKNAVQIISEIGLKLGHVLWRKFADEERDDADASLNQTGFDLIMAREYRVAERMLDFGAYTLKRHGTEFIRRSMIVNLANAVRLMGENERAVQILDNEDWSATGPDFRICVAAVREDTTTVCRLMREGGERGPLTAEQYREWPVFRDMRRHPEFRETFKEIFGQEVLSTELLKMSPGRADDVTEITVTS